MNELREHISADNEVERNEKDQEYADLDQNKGIACSRCYPIDKRKGFEQEGRRIERENEGYHPASSEVYGIYEKDDKKDCQKKSIPCKKGSYFGCDKSRCHTYSVYCKLYSLFPQFFHDILCLLGKFLRNQNIYPYHEVSSVSGLQRHSLAFDSQYFSMNHSFRDFNGQTSV